MYSVIGLKDYYTLKWNAMQITRNGAVNSSAALVLKGKDIYKHIEKLTGVPWYVIGIIHLRESSCNFNTHLHNGDPLSARTYHVPAGYPRTGSPPFTFEFSAVDALNKEGATSIKSWPIEQIAFFFEQYNGWGYHMNGIPSAYLWAGSNQYVSGKYVSDGVFDSSAVDVQVGTMCVLKSILESTGEKIYVQNASMPADDKTFEATPRKPTSKEMNTISRKHWWTTVTQWFTTVSAGGLATVKAVDATQIQATKSWVDAINDFGHAYGFYFALFALLMVGLYCAFQKRYMIEDYLMGRWSPSGGRVDPNVPQTIAPVVEAVQP